MKRIVSYKCEYCGKTFDDEHSCHTHENEHLGISENEFVKWQKLRKNAIQAGSKVYCTCNDETRKQFDDACEAQTQFEITHGLLDKKFPG